MTTNTDVFQRQEGTNEVRRLQYAIAAVFLILGGAALADGQSKVKPKPKPTPKPAPTKTPPTAAKPVSVKCNTNNLTETEIADLLAGHNKARVDLKLNPMVWDCGLANMAQDWASKSIYEHRDTSLGENMFVAGDTAATVGSVIDRWLAEKVNWNNSAGTCSAGKTCTHYTQMVWRASAKVGCGINRKATGKWKAVLVCNYDPPSKSPGAAY